MNRYFYDPSTASWGSADDLEIFELDDQNMDADEIEQALCDASHAGAGLGLKYMLDHRYTEEQVSEMQAIAAVIANLEGIGSGDMQATLEELQSFGTNLLAIIEQD